MMGRTHAFLGVSSLWLLAPFPDALTPQTVAPLCALAAFGALLPDLDAAESTIKSLRIGGIRPFAPLSVLAYRTWGHRGLLHSPLGLLLFGLVCVPVGVLWGVWPALALWLGYASHLAGDACHPHGHPRLAQPRRPKVVAGSPPLRASLPAPPKRRSSSPCSPSPPCCSSSRACPCAPEPHSLFQFPNAHYAPIPLHHVPSFLPLTLHALARIPGRPYAGRSSRSGCSAASRACLRACCAACCGRN